jgi:hypothetical protein
MFHGSMASSLARRFATWAAALATALTLAACGGGGGGGSDASVSFDTSSLSLSVQAGAFVGTGAVPIGARASGLGSNDNVYVGAEVIGSGVVSPLNVTIDAASLTAIITVLPDPGLAPGVYSSRLRLLACLDPQCNRHLSGSPHEVAVTTTVTPRFSASVTALSFAVPESAAPAAQGFDLTFPDGGGPLSLAVAYEGADTGWLSATADGTRVTVQPAAGLRAGTYRARLDLSYGSPAQTLQIPVQVDVSSGLVVAGRLDLAVRSDSPASVASGSLTVRVASGASSAAWTARSTVPWLVLETTGGQGDGQIAWRLDPAAFATLANATVHTGSIVVEAGSTVTPQDVVVSLDKSLAEFSSIDRLAVLAGEPGEVMLYGRQLDQLTDPLLRLVAPGIAPVSAARQGSGQISLQVPALAAGRYSLSLSTASGLPTRSVTLEVLAARDLGAQAIDTQGRKGTVVWDAARQAVYVHNTDLGSVMRFQLGGTVASPTGSVTARSIAGLRNIGLAPDGASLLALTGPGELLDLSLADLSTLRTRALPGPVFPALDGLPIAVTGDLSLWYSAGDFGGTLAVYDLEASAARNVTLPLDVFFYNGPWAGVSPNRQRMLMTQSASVSPAPPMLRWDAVDNALVSQGAGLPVSFFTRFATDRRGTRWLLDGLAVYDFQLGTLGRIQPPDGWYGIVGAMSRDGSRAYLVTRDGGTTTTRVYVFDTGTDLVTTTEYPVLGSFDLAQNAACDSQASDSLCNAFAMNAVLTDDDRTLITVGDRRLVVTPIPAEWRGGPLSARGPRAALRLNRGPGTR